MRLGLVGDERRGAAGCRPPYRVKNSSIGVLGPGARLAGDDMRSLLQQAQEFAREWRELRAIVRSKLCGKLLRCPLEACPALSLPACLLVPSQ